MSSTRCFVAATTGNRVSVAARAAAATARRRRTTAAAIPFRMRGGGVRSISAFVSSLMTHNTEPTPESTLSAAAEVAFISRFQQQQQHHHKQQQNQYQQQRNFIQQLQPQQQQQQRTYHTSLMVRKATAKSATATAQKNHSSDNETDNIKSLQQENQEQQPLLDPLELCGGKLPMPKALSPSSILEFRQCPQSFLFQYILSGLKQPTNTVLAKGTLCHTALEQVFDLTPADRTLENLQNLFRRAWSVAQREKPDQYGHLFVVEEEEEGDEKDMDGDEQDDDNETPPTQPLNGRRRRRRLLEEEATWGREGLQLLVNYMRLEDPTRVEPAHRELWVRKELTVDPNKGATGYTTTTTTASKSTATSSETFLVRGIIDRLDLVRTPKSSPQTPPQQEPTIPLATKPRTTSSYYNNSSGAAIAPAASSGSSSNVQLRITDYKTGAAPQFKYSPLVNERIRNETFFQLMLYALLLREKGADVKYDTLQVRFLRLIYLKERGEVLELDLGATLEERDARLQSVHQEASQVWTSIQELIQQQDPTLFVGCNRSFCYCHVCRPRFVPGTVWTPTSPTE